MDDESRLDRILADWRERQDAGEYLDPEDVIRAHPALAESLRRRFAALAALDEVLESGALAGPDPETIGSYRILRKLGEGGMGTVYLADPGDGQPVALKVLHSHLLASPGFFKRFLREAEIGQRVEHANVVRTLDCDQVFVSGAPVSFLVMEYVEGQTLRELKAELGRLPEDLCRHVGREIASALDAIHGCGVVHRDLKPENVLITHDHVIKVMDLGIARLADETMRLSKTGGFVGSVLYAAPEQFGGVEPDHRADWYSLGLMLYELAAGQHPSRADDFASVMRKRLDETPRPLGSVNPQVSAYFEELVSSLMDRDPESRLACFHEEDSDWWRQRARELRAQTKRPLRRIRIPRETVLYGRDEELEQLGALLEQALKAEGQVVLVEGEAGIGKSRLIDEFVGQVSEDVNFLFGSYPPGGAATAAGAFSEAFREHFGDIGCQDYLPGMKALVPAVDALLRGAPPPESAAPLTKDSVQTAFVEATRALAAERPTILLIEDLHFAPQEGLALFASLALAVPGHRIVLIGTTRPGLRDDWLASVTRLEHTHQIALGRLGPKDLGALLRDAFHSDRLADELGWRIAQKSDGNPFFAFEIIRGLREGQFITKALDGTWSLTRKIEKIRIPSSVLDLIQARVADLDPDEKNLLDVAACCGFEFDPLLVAQVLGLQQIPAMRHLAHIEAKHRLVRAAGRRFVFDHHQVQEALYEAMPQLLREPYHAGLAEALEARTDGQVDGATAVELCRHWFDGVKPGRAAVHLKPAVGHLEQGYLHGDAIALMRRALDTPDLLRDRERVKVLLRLAKCLEFIGCHEEQTEASDAAIAVGKELDDPELLAQAVVARAASLSRRGLFDEADRAYGEVLGQSGRIGLAALVGRGACAIRRGEYERGQDLLNQAVARPSGQDDEIQLDAQQELAFSSYIRGSYAEAQDRAARAGELARSRGDRRAEARALNTLGSAAYGEYRFEDAGTHFQDSSRIYREIGARGDALYPGGNLGHVLWARGELESACEQYERQITLARELGSATATAQYSVGLGGVLLDLGRLSEAREHLERAFHGARVRNEANVTRDARCWLATLAECEGDLEEATRVYTDHLAKYRKEGNNHGAVEALRDLGRVAHDAGDVDTAVKHFDRAIESARDCSPENLVYSSCWRALLPGGDAGRAVDLFDRHQGRMRFLVKMECRFVLWKATGEREHLEDANRMLGRVADGVATPEGRTALLQNVPLNRKIAQAWERLSSDAPQ